ncbi:MAG: diaminopimelate epimerase, partial [Fimbriimonadaceae bacterium]
MRFTKMHGIGNDFVMVDALHEQPRGNLEELSRKVCDRKFGVGADGLILTEKGTEAEFRMRMFNPDGSESEMCGNGVRCFAQFLRAEGRTSDTTITVETGAGRLVLEVLPDDRVRVDMGKARLSRGDIGMTGDASERFKDEPVEALGETYRGNAVSMGNPHLVLFVDRDITDEHLKVGPVLEKHPEFPARTNVHLAKVLSRGQIRQWTWERGAGATLACGTGACSVAVAA